MKKNHKHLWRKSISGFLVCSICTGVLIESIKGHESMPHLPHENTNPELVSVSTTTASSTATILTATTTTTI